MYYGKGTPAHSDNGRIYACSFRDFNQKHQYTDQLYFIFSDVRQHCNAMCTFATITLLLKKLPDMLGKQATL